MKVRERGTENSSKYELLLPSRPYNNNEMSKIFRYKNLSHSLNRFKCVDYSSLAP